MSKEACIFVCSHICLRKEVTPCNVFSYLEFFELFCFLWVLLSFADDGEKILRQNEGDPFPIYAKLFLEVSQKVPKVDMKYPTIVTYL